MEGHTIVGWLCDLLCWEMKGHWSSLYEKHAKRCQGTGAVCMRSMPRDVEALYLYDTMIYEIYVIGGCIYDIRRWSKGHCSNDIAWYWDVLGVGVALQPWIMHVFDWLYIRLFDVVCLFDCYTIYYLRWVLHAWWNSFHNFGLTILKPTLYEHSLSYTHFVVP